MGEKRVAMEKKGRQSAECQAGCPGQATIEAARETKKILSSAYSQGPRSDGCGTPSTRPIENQAPDSSAVRKGLRKKND